MSEDTVPLADREGRDAPPPEKWTIAQRILATVAEFRRKGTLESSLCWPAEELERLAMFAISAKNDLVRGSSQAGSAPRLEARLEHLKSLGANWDSYGAPPITPEAAAAALRWLQRVWIWPRSNGGLQLGWDEDGQDVLIAPDGSFESRDGEPVRAGSAGSPDAAIRKLLWLRHGCPIGALYGDDGEMSCGACGIDFLRWSAEQIERSFAVQHLKPKLRAASPSSGEGREPQP